MLRRFIEAKASQNARCPRGRRMRANINEVRLNFANARRIGRDLGFGHQARAFEIGGKDEIDQVLRPARRFLLDTAETRCSGERYETRVWREFACDHFEQRRLSGAVAADEAHARVRGQGDGGLVEKNAWPEPQRDVVYVEHAGFSPAWPAQARARQRLIDSCLNQITEGLFSSRAWNALNSRPIVPRCLT